MMLSCGRFCTISPSLGVRLISRLHDYHSPATTSDYADDVVSDLQAGHLVIVDQSTGDPEMNKASGERLMWRVFNRQREDFIHPHRDDKGAIVPPPDIIVYVEEAHNLLPAKADDLTTVWSRVAKEGSKFRIGLAYATQEPSSIQSNILKNTDNWFVAHLNNADELREIKKYYDLRTFHNRSSPCLSPAFCACVRCQILTRCRCKSTASLLGRNRNAVRRGIRDG